MPAPRDAAPGITVTSLTPSASGDQATQVKQLHAVMDQVSHSTQVNAASAEELSAGYTHVKCTSTGAGTVVAVLHDLKTQRTPGNLPALV